MSKIVKQIISRNASTQPKAEPVTCNYSNNYYGDQVCRPTQVNAKISQR